MSFLTQKTDLERKTKSATIPDGKSHGLGVRYTARIMQKRRKKKNGLFYFRRLWDKEVPSFQQPSLPSKRATRLLYHGVSLYAILSERAKKTLVNNRSLSHPRSSSKK